MSEKRLRFTMESDTLYSCIFDNGEELTCFELVDLLNKQQTLINALKKENKELKKGVEVPIPYVENSMRRLRAEHKVDEQQATIERLGEENKELEKNFTDLVEWASEIAKRNVVLGEENASLKQRIRDIKYNNCD